MAVTLQDLGKWQSEANRYQSIGDDAQRKVAQIEMQGSQAKLDRLKFLQTHTELRAPDQRRHPHQKPRQPRRRSLELGKPFCEIAAT